MYWRRPTASHAEATVATLIDVRERPRVDAAAGGSFAAFHADTVHDVLRTVRERPVRAVLVSPRRVGQDQLHGVAELIRGFPSVPTVAVVSQHDTSSSERLLALGALGVTALFDLSVRDGWHRLRDLVANPASPAAAIIARVSPALGNAPPGCHRFFEVLVDVAPVTPTVRALTRHLGIRPSTFMSRFLRAGLPSPKRYLSAVRLVYAAGLMEAPGYTIADVAYRLEYSSPQSFGRHLRAVMGLTAGEFRHRYPFPVAVDDFVRRMILPFRSGLRTFHPLDPGVEAPGRRP